MKDINEIVDRILGEQNLYKIDRWKYPDKLCRHNEAYVCRKCADDLNKEDDMRIEITLHDEDGQPAIIVSNCHKDSEINIAMLHGAESANVSVDDLRSAIRKLTAK